MYLARKENNKDKVQKYLQRQTILLKFVIYLSKVVKTRLSAEFLEIFIGKLQQHMGNFDPQRESEL